MLLFKRKMSDKSDLQKNLSPLWMYSVCRPLCLYSLSLSFLHVCTYCNYLCNKTKKQRAEPSSCGSSASVRMCTGSIRELQNYHWQPKRNFSPGKVKSSRGLGQNIVPVFQLKITDGKAASPPGSSRPPWADTRTVRRSAPEPLPAGLEHFWRRAESVWWVLGCKKKRELALAARVVLLSIVIVALKNL